MIMLLDIGIAVSASLIVVAALWLTNEHMIRRSEREQG